MNHPRHGVTAALTLAALLHAFGVTAAEDEAAGPGAGGDPVIPCATADRRTTS